MDRFRPVLSLMPAVLAGVIAATLAGCGSSSSGAQAGPTGTPAASASTSPSASAGAQVTASPAGTSSRAGTPTPKPAKPSKRADLSALGGYASGVGSGPASSRCALTAAQVGASVGEPVKATSLESTGGGLACYYRATSSTSTRSLTVTVQKVPVAGLYAQSRKVNAGGTTKEMQDAGAVVQNCAVTDRTFGGRPAFTTRCTTVPDRQRLGSIEWDYQGGRFFYVGVQAVGRTDRTAAQLVTVSQALAGKLAA